ncbi:MAG: MarR family winged helix-turn-helix transcriptional regulator [Myxococcaceae bacterium]
MRKSSNAEVESIRESLVSLRRLFQRRDVTELWEAAFGRQTGLNYADLRLLDAVRVAESKGGATVGAISRLVGVDPSRASRHVASAVGKGLLARRASQRDGRQVVLEVTAAGARLQAKGAELTRRRIALALERFPSGERARFAASFASFVAGML